MMAQRIGYPYVENNLSGATAEVDENFVFTCDSECFYHDNSKPASL